MSTPSAVYEVFFTGKDDPRHGAIVIGEDTKPQFFRFETPEVYMGDTRTTVNIPFTGHQRMLIPDRYTETRERS